MNARRTQRRGLAWFALMALVAAVGCSSSTDGPPPEATEDVSQADSTQGCGSISVAPGQTVNLSSSPAGVYVPGTIVGTNAAQLAFGQGGTTVVCNYRAGLMTGTGGVLTLTTCSQPSLRGGSSITGVTKIVLCAPSSSCGAKSATIPLAVDDGNPCTADSCSFAGGLGGGVRPIHTPQPAGFPCPDANVCNGTEVCNPTGQCLAGSGTPLPVDDGNACTTDSCDPTLGVENTPITTGACAPDPSFVPPGNDGTVPTNIANGGWPNASQTGVCTGCADAIDKARVAVVRGRIVDAGGAPIAGATVSVLGHAGFGQTATRSDGAFDLAVNGGAEYTIDVEKPGYLPLHRNAKTRWQDYTVLADATLSSLSPVMTAPGTGATTVTLDGQHPLQTLVGPTSTDADGSRTPVLIFPQGTQITWQGQSTSAVQVRATEFTVGPSGLRAMPGDLPPASAYTYAVEFSVDQAGSANVAFSQPVVQYLENFVGFDMSANHGTVPSGYYDRAAGQWVPSANGQIVQIVGQSGGAAQVALTPNGADAPDAAFTPPMAPGERQALWSLYGARLGLGKPVTLWRVGLSHFTPYDFNWGYGLPADAVKPNLRKPSGDDPLDDPCYRAGSIIECQNQILAEEIPIAGTPYVLRYQSERQRGRAVSLDIPITPANGSSLPYDLTSILVDVYAAGRQWHYFVPKPAAGWPDNQVQRWTWDRTNAYGEYVSGRTPVHVAIGYVYPGAYGQAGSFGATAVAGSITGNRTLRQLALWQYHDVWVGQFDAKGLGFGGWTLSASHVYDAASRTFYGGDGRRRQGLSAAPTIARFGGSGQFEYGPPADGTYATADAITPQSVVAAPDGGVYVGDRQGAIEEITRDGIVRRLAPAANLGSGLALGRDGWLYYGATASAGGGVWKIPSAIPTSAVYTPQNVVTGASIGTATSVAVGADGSVYALVPQSGGSKIWRRAPDGSVSLMAGGGTGSIVDGAASTAGALTATTIAIGPNGDLYFNETGATYCLVREVLPTGTVTTVAGPPLTASASGNCSADASLPTDGGPANAAWFHGVDGIAFAPDGTLYVTDYGASVVRAVGTDGIIRRVAGTGQIAYAGDGGPGPLAALDEPVGTAVGADGSVFIAEFGSNTIRRIASPMPGWSAAGASIPSDDGGELYVFDASGRHLRTLSSSPTWDAANQKPAVLTLASFAYDPASGQLTAVTDGDGNVTTVARSSGTVTITAPFGQQTTLVLDPGSGYLASITNPNGEKTSFGYDVVKPGLLTSLVDPKGNAHVFQYSPDGLLIADTNAAGGTTTLALTRNPYAATWEVDVTNATSHTTQYTVGEIFPIPAGESTGQRRTITSPSGAVTTIDKTDDQRQFISSPDGAVATTVLSPDPQFGLAAPLASLTVSTPSGLSLSLSDQRTIVASAGAASNPAAITKSTTTHARSADGKTYSSTATYDVAARTITTTLSGASPRKTTATLDAKNRVRQLNVYDLAPITFTYNDAPCAPTPTDGCGGRLVSTSQASAADGSRTVTIHYNDGQGADTGLPTSIVDALGRTTRFTLRDLVGRPQTVTLPDGTSTVALGYDPNGNLTSTTTPASNTHAFGYSPEDLASSYTPPAAGTSGTTSYGYNTDDTLASLVDPDGQTRVRYDTYGRTWTVTHPYDSVTYGYDWADNVVDLSSSASDVSYTLDGSLLTGITWSGTAAGSLSIGYNGFFQPTSLTVQAGAGSASVSFQYNDPDGLLTGTSDFAIARDPVDGWMGSTSLGAVSDVRKKNGFGEPTVYTSAAAGGAPLYAVTYARDPSKAGRVAQKTESLPAVGSLAATSNVVTAYGYDDAAPGQHATGALVRDGVHAYEYDLDGNRYKRDGVVVAAYDAQDRLLYAQPAPETGAPANTWNCYTYTTGGSLSSKKVITSTNPATDCPNAAGATSTYAYDVLGNLRVANIATPSGTKSITYTIDAENHRVAKTVNGTVVAKYLYSGLHPIAELTPGGALARMFVYATSPSIPDYVVVPGGDEYRIVSDQLGSPRLVVNARTGVIVQRTDFDAWGNVVAEAVCGATPTAGCAATDAAYTAIPFGFAGGLRDPDTGLTRFGARDYDPTIGRWVTKDPSGLAGGMNLYAYADGDPVNLVDLDGEAAKDPPGYFDFLPGASAYRNYKRAFADRQEAMLQLSNDATVEQGLRGLARSGCEFAIAGLKTIQDATFDIGMAYGGVALGRLPEIGVFQKVAKSDKIVGHHIFPQARVFTKYWKSAGIDIHDYIAYIPRSWHESIHSGVGMGPGGYWNAAWRDFFAGNPRPSREAIMEFGAWLSEKFNLYSYR